MVEQLDEKRGEISQETILATAIYRGKAARLGRVHDSPFAGNIRPCAAIFVSSTTRLGGFNARLILYLTRFECSVKLITYGCVQGVQRTDDRWVVSDASWHALD